MDITLRPYQREALSKILWAQTLSGNDLVVLPTGAGKSIVIAHLAKSLNKPILILQPSKEILEQNLAKLSLYVDRGQIGVYSASMNEKTVGFYTFATIQSIYKKPQDFAHFSCVIVDECHLVNPKNLSGMFTTFLKDIGSPKVIGFTATPYRMDIGWRREGGQLSAYTTTKLINRTKAFFWNRLLYNINNADLLAQGYLCPLEYVDKSLLEHSEIPTNKSQSDFDMDGFEKKISSKEQQILNAIEYGGRISKSVLVFCSSVCQAKRLKELLPDSEIVTATTGKNDRASAIDRFRNGEVKVILNVGVLTTGFDHPALDCIVLIRPTRSIGLYYQMLGRGVRIAPNKTSCKVIDLTSTVRNLGKVETIRLEKVGGKWELLSEAGSWHNKELYSFTVKPKAEPENRLDVLSYGAI